MVDQYNKRKAEKMTGETCDVCDTPLYSDPGVHELGIYLHARRYHSGDGRWDYETGLPEWALPPKDREGPTVATEESDPLAVDLKKLGLEDEEPVEKVEVKKDGEKVEKKDEKRIEPKPVEVEDVEEEEPVAAAAAA